jgi:hypothetical protein
VGRLFIPQRNTVSADAKLDRIAQRRAAQNLDSGPIAKAHLKQAAAGLVIPADGNDMSMATHAQLVQTAGSRRTDVRASREITCLLHRIRSHYKRVLMTPK